MSKKRISRDPPGGVRAIIRTLSLLDSLVVLLWPTSTRLAPVRVRSRRN